MSGQCRTCISFWVLTLDLSLFVLEFFGDWNRTSYKLNFYIHERHHRKGGLNPALLTPS